MLYVPCYLDGADGIFNLTYYQLLPGLDATVFASYYEPWGYTPLESVAFGVPTVTTDLAGFGLWVEEACEPGFATSGVSVVHRDDSNYAAARDAIVKDLETLIAAPAKEMTAYRKAASETARKAQWTDFIRFYDQSYCNALEHRDERNLK